MSHQRYPSIDPVKEPHSVSLKVLRLSRPSLVTQHPLQAPFSSSAHNSNNNNNNNHDTTTTATAPMPASLAYGSSTTTTTTTDDDDDNTTAATSKNTTTNPAPFLLAPILNLPPSFGSAYVGETFSCTLCANHDIPPDPLPAVPGILPSPGGGAQLTTPAPRMAQHQKNKFIRDVRIEAEMKTPGSGGTVQKLVLGPSSAAATGPGQGVNEGGGDGDGEGEGEEGGGNKKDTGGGSEGGGTDLEPNQTLQRIVNFDLKEEGNHVLAVTVSYYEATETSGRTRTFRKLYQFICKGSLIVRTKVSPLPSSLFLMASADGGEEEEKKKGRRKGKKGGGGGRKKTRKGRCWAMEAQLENCSEDVMQLERVGLDLEAGLRFADCNFWGAGGGGGGGAGIIGGGTTANNKPVLHPGEVEQCCFVVEEEEEDAATVLTTAEDRDGGGRIVFGVLGIGWRSEMGNKGFLSTGKLGTRVAAR